MKIVTPPDFFQTFKDKHILLDTYVFIDAFLNPSEFGKLFIELRSNGTTLISLDLVKAEFLKGAINSDNTIKRKSTLISWLAHYYL